MSTPNPPLLGAHSELWPQLLAATSLQLRQPQTGSFSTKLVAPNVALFGLGRLNMLGMSAISGLLTSPRDNSSDRGGSDGSGSDGSGSDGGSGGGGDCGG